MSTIRVLLVDDHRVVADGFQALLEQEPDIEVIGIAEDGAEALQLAQQKQPDVVVMDVSMPKGMDGVTATQRLRDLCPGCRVLLLTTYDHDEYVVQGLQAGARGYLLKNVARSQFVQHIHSVARGELVLHPDVYATVFERLQHAEPDESLPDHPLLLTEREEAVLRLVRENVSNQDIATRLGITIATVKRHLSNIYDKLDVRNRVLAVKEAERRGFLEHPGR
jgi:DNA-binding NarL/FixJ family response regulator